MNTKKKNNSIGNKKKISALYFAAFFILQFSSIFIAVKAIQPYLNFIKILGLLLLLIYILIANRKTTTFRSMACFTLASIAIIICSYITDSYYLISSLLLIYGGRTINFEKLLRNDIKIKVLFTAILLLLSLLGLTPNKVFARDNGIIRSTFGFIHPNTFAFYIAIILIEWLYINRKETKKKVIGTLIGLIMTIFLMKYVDSRSSELLILAAIIIQWIPKKNKQKCAKKANIAIIGTLIYLPFLLISLLAPIGYKANNPLCIDINQKTNNRILFISRYTSQYDITLFGNDISSSDYPIDNAYMYILIKYGILASILTALYCSYVMKETLNNNDKTLFRFLILILAYGLMENTIVCLEIIPFYIYGSRRTKK